VRERTGERKRGAQDAAAPILKGVGGREGKDGGGDSVGGTTRWATEGGWGA
jgi:hypothetical protein